MRFLHQEKAGEFQRSVPLEVRAQCAQVVAMVNHLPHEAERFAVEAMLWAPDGQANGIAVDWRVIVSQFAHFSDAALWNVLARIHAWSSQREGVTVGARCARFRDFGRWVFFSSRLSVDSGEILARANGLIARWEISQSLRLIAE